MTARKYEWPAPGHRDNCWQSRPRIGFLAPIASLSSIPISAPNIFSVVSQVKL